MKGGYDWKQAIQTGKGKRGGRERTEQTIGLKTQKQGGGVGGIANGWGRNTVTGEHATRGCFFFVQKRGRAY